MVQSTRQGFVKQCIMAEKGCESRPATATFPSAIEPREKITGSIATDAELWFEKPELLLRSVSPAQRSRPQVEPARPALWLRSGSRSATGRRVRRPHS